MTSEKTQAAFNLPYNQSSQYWLAIFTSAEADDLRKALAARGFRPLAARPNVLTQRLAHPWCEPWKDICAAIAIQDPEKRTDVSLIPGDVEPSLQEYGFAQKNAASLDMLCDSLWLGEAMMEDRVVCYMQPVLDKSGKVFGYESFARVAAEKGVIGGGKIIEASKCLNIEYALDRHMHVKAIESFIASDLEGYLFINFVPGFIHRPEKYLEGLSEAVRFHGMPAKNLVLDFTHSELSRDPTHMKSIFTYCKSKGYSLSLDDISSMGAAKKIFDTIHPDFIKLDIDLVQEAKEAPQQRIVGELIALAHSCGTSVLAEGVETKAVHDELLAAGVDLFQGYLFSPPVAISALKQAAG